MKNNNLYNNLENIDNLNDMIIYVNQKINKFIELDSKVSLNSNKFNSKLHEAVYYSILNGGKRLRPLLTYLSGLLFNTNESFLIYPAVAIEFIHSFTLVHDDLPSMDNDILRRGKPTTHIKFNEATAILAGDSMLSYSFDIVLRNNISDKQKILQIKELSSSSNFNGVCLGQDLDIQNENNKNITIEELKIIHKFKTSSLIKASLLLGIYSSYVYKDNVIVNIISKLSENLGILYQIKDDILDVEGEQSLIGKTVNSDINNHKITYVSLLGIEQAKIEIQNYKLKCNNIILDLKDYIYNNELNNRNTNKIINILTELVDYFSLRNK